MAKWLFIKELILEEAIGINKMSNQIKIMIIDDSAIVRRVLSEELTKDPELEIIGTAPDVYIGRDKIVNLKPDVLLLDIEMPKMDGLTFLDILMKHYPLPVIIISSLTGEGEALTLKALELGAVDVIAKPGSSYSLKEMCQQLTAKIKVAAKTNPGKKFSSENPVSTKKNAANSQNPNRIIAIGASTGGTEAIRSILANLPETTPPIVIVQHMPPLFIKAFANRLDEVSKIKVKEAENKELATPNKALIAPGNLHMVLKKRASGYYVDLKDGPLVHHQRPSVEVLFSSVAKYAAADAIGVILTGMGKDGAKGLLEMKEAGAYTIAQDEKSCVIFGMPKEAIALGGVSKIMPLNNIPEFLINF